MPPKRKSSDGTSLTKRSKRQGKKLGVLSMRMPQVFKFSRTISTNNSGSSGVIIKTSAAGIPQFAASGTAGNSLQLSFMLSGVNVYVDGTFCTTVTTPGYTDMTALFDQYRIAKVHVSCMATYDGNEVTVLSNSGQLPFAAYTPDYDDNANTSLTDLQQYDQVKYTNFSSVSDGPRKLISFTPRVAMNVYNTAVTTGYGPAPQPTWLDCSSASVPHYALKFALDNNNIVYPLSVNVAVINFIFRYELELRNQR